MSESHENPRAALAASLPHLLPHGFRCGIDIQLQVVPKMNVIVAPASQKRPTAEGVVELLVGEPAEWRRPPEGAEVFELGKPIPPDKCDIAVVIGARVQDMLGPKLVTPGQQPAGSESQAAIAVLARKTLSVWQQEHLGALRGPVE